MNVKVHWNKNAYGNLGLSFAPSQERLVEEGLGVQAVTLSKLIKSLGGGDPILGKTRELGGFQTGGEDRMVNDEQLGLGRVELVQQFVDGEGGVSRGDSTEPVRSPGSDGGLDVIGMKEATQSLLPMFPAGLRDVGKTAGASSDLLEMVAPARVIVNKSRSGLEENGPVWMLIVEEELGDGHVGGNAPLGETNSWLTG